MRLAVTQPDFFPHLGDWQLMTAVDRFVTCDDLSLVTQG
jgi:hypothetical protein